MEGAIAPIRVLPEIADRVGRDMAIMLDRGVRRESDVLKALANGAHFVFVGRPFLFAAATHGHAGVTHAIQLSSEEIDRNMALLGVSKLVSGAPLPPCASFSDIARIGLSELG